MNGIGRAALVAAILAAGFFTLLEARSPNGLLGGLADGAARVAYAAEWVVQSVTSIFGDREVGDATAPRSAQEATEFTWSGKVATGAVLEIKGVNGPIVAGLASGSEVEVRATKQGRRSDPSEVRVEVVEHEKGVTLCAVYPSARGGENHCGPGDEGRNQVNNNDVSVSFFVRVPAGVVLHSRTVNGDLEIEGLESDVVAASVNGDVSITTTGYAVAQTVNGSIEAVMGLIDPDGMSFSTVNGSIELDIPDDLDADLRASWLNGSIETDLPFSLQGRVSKRSAAGQFGAGGPNIELKTVNGSIRIR
jgi:hypothetical protein